VWLVQLRWAVNLMVPTLLAGLMVFAAVPRDELPERLKSPRERLSKVMRSLSLSQTWNMYAPDPQTGHFFMQLYAHDADGQTRTLEESWDAEHGWGTVWAWQRDRKHIWQLAVGRHVTEVNRNRTWYLRGVCVREARLGHAIRRVEMYRVFRRIRPPERVAAGADLLGPPKRRKPGAGEGSCNVQIIREMIATDPMRADLREAHE
jgi:hypothetical protein